MTKAVGFTPTFGVPKSVEVYYSLFQNPKPQGPSDSALQEAVIERWQTRPNWFNPVEGPGPFREGLRNIGSFLGFVFSRLIVDRTLTLTDCQTPPGVDGKFVAVVSIHRYVIKK